MILHDRCSTGFTLVCAALWTWDRKIAKRIGTRPSVQDSTLHFLRKSLRIASFLTLSVSKTEEVSQACFDFDVAKFKTEEVWQKSFVLNSFVFKLADRKADRPTDR